MGVHHTGTAGVLAALRCLEVAGIRRPLRRRRAASHFAHALPLTSRLVFAFLRSRQVHRLEVAVEHMHSSDVVPVRRRRSVFSIIGMLVVGLVLLVVLYFAYVGWSNKGKPVPDVDVKTSAVGTVLASSAQASIETSTGA